MPPTTTFCSTQSKRRLNKRFMKKKVLIIGGGNIGTLIAADIAEKADVTVYSSRAREWAERISVYDDNGALCFTSGRIAVTDDPENATKNADWVFVTVPAFMFGDIAKRMENSVSAGQVICVVPGGGGAEFAFKRLSDKGATLVGFQRVHSIARLKEYGKSVCALGRKNRIEIASIPSRLAAGLCAEIEKLFSMPCTSLNNYLCLTLTPSNPILHTSRLYALFRDYRREKTYERNSLFYEEWDDFSSRVLLEMDAELQALCAAIPLDLREVVSLKNHYESFSVQAMTEKIRSIAAFKGIYTPMRADGGKYRPDFSSRYFISDFDFGLKIIYDIAVLFGVKTPVIKSVLDWYFSVTDESRSVFEMKIGKDELLTYYS